MDMGPEEIGNTGSEAQMNRKLKQKIHYVLTNITVEPLVILYYFPMTLASFATNNLNWEKACRVKLAYNSSVCDSVTAKNLTEIQAEVINMQKWTFLLRLSLPAIFVIFVGSWSDRTAKRKPLLLLPVFGEFLTSIGLLLSTYFYLEWPMEVTGMIEGLFPFMTGSNMVLVMAVFSYISDITTAEERTFRIGVLNLVVLVCSSLGQFLGGILLNKVKFYGMFSISAVLYMLGFIYCWFYVKEPRHDIIPSTDSNQKVNFLNCGLIRETFLILFKKRENYQRLVLCTILCAFIFLLGSSFGENSLTYWFLQIQLQWDEKDIGYISTYSTIVTFIGTFITVSVLSKILKLHDCIIGLLVCITRAIAEFGYAFSYEGWHLYLASTIDILSGASLIPVRSIVSKTVPANEIGMTFSLMGICEGITTATFVPLYGAIYNETVKTFAGAFFIVGSMFSLIAGAIFVTIYVLSKKSRTHLDEHPVQLDATQSKQTTKEQHDNDAFECEEQKSIESKL